MLDPINASVSPLRPVAPGAATGVARPAEGTAGGENFASLLQRQLEQVNKMQNEADQGVQNLLTGQTQNVTEVFTTARKAQLAFSLLMEIRNKLVDAYTELNQMRV